MTPTLKSKLTKITGYAKKENVEWVLEGIVGYLHSPAWNVPIMNFFDENCECFENKEENKFEYTDIHLKYKALVENILAKYIVELGISEDTFSKACDQHNSTINGVEGLFEYIWAADDFLLFKRLMSNHNLRLEMQTINLLHTLEGSREDSESNLPYNPKYMEALKKDRSTSGATALSNNFNPDEGVMREILDESQDTYAAVMMRQKELEDQEASDLRKAIEYSKREMERLNAQAEEERRMLDEAIRLSLQYASLASDGTDEMPVVENKQAYYASLTSEGTAEKPVVQTDEKSFNSIPTIVPVPPAAARESSSTTDTRVKSSRGSSKSKQKTAADPASLPPLRQKNHPDASLDWLSSAARENSSVGADPVQGSTPNVPFDTSLSSSKGGIDAAELAKRKHYLQEQRTKLLELKKKKRDEELERYISESPEAKKTVEQKQPQPNDGAEEHTKIMNARRALADRLKREVIQKK